MNTKFCLASSFASHYLLNRLKTVFQIPNNQISAICLHNLRKHDFTNFSTHLQQTKCLLNLSTPPGNKNLVPTEISSFYHVRHSPRNLSLNTNIHRSPENYNFIRLHKHSNPYIFIAFTSLSKIETSSKFWTRCHENKSKIHLRTFD